MECQRCYSREHYQRNKTEHNKRRNANRNRERAAMREFVREVKDVPCADCGNHFPTCAMDFDHVRDKKLFNISQLWTMKKLIEEIAKCEVVCSNCHRIRTWIRRVEADR